MATATRKSAGSKSTAWNEIREAERLNEAIEVGAFIEGALACSTGLALYEEIMFTTNLPHDDGYKLTLEFERCISGEKEFTAQVAKALRDIAARLLSGAEQVERLAPLPRKI